MRGVIPIGAAFVLLVSAHALAHGPRYAARGPTADDAHEPVALPNVAPTHALSLRRSRSAVAGFDLELLVERFSLQPAPASDASTEEPRAPASTPAGRFAAGYARLFVTGAEMQRIGEPSVHLRLIRLADGSFQGAHAVRAGVR